jgi:aspartyl-tRNA(Asn)/glutamyl-tRNA(Gln) amidotransferase subunit A
MGERAKMDLGQALRTRLAAAGMEVPPDETDRLERDLALHLQRVAALTAAADLDPTDPPRTDPTTAVERGAAADQPTPRFAGPGTGRADEHPPTAGSAVPRTGRADEHPPTSGLAGPRTGRVADGGNQGAGLSTAPGAPLSTAPGVGLIEQARMVREGEASSVELVERALERIDHLDPRVGAFVLVLADEARAEAGERDAARRRGEALGPLHGVPVGVKDLIDVAGAVTAAGSPKLAGNRAAADAEVVARLRAAGAVIVGKTRTHEFAYGVVTPGTVNPLDPERIAGGSSGGSAAAVAAGMVPAALGSDTAGSIRIPSACCGLVGLKPTWGRVPATGVWPLSWSCDHVGPIAATVADVALLDEVLAADPAGPAAPGPDRRRIGRVVGDDLGPVDPAVTAAVDELCRRLEAAGAVLDEVTLPLDAARGAVATIVLAEAAQAHARLLAETGEEGYSRAMLSMIRIGGSALAEEYLTGLRYRGRFAATVEGLLAGRDALLLPTLPCVAPPAGSRTVTIAGTEVGVQAALTRLPGPFNCSGSPVLTLPAGPVDTLPIGVSLVGRIGGDRDLLGVAAWVEALAPVVRPPAMGA